MNGIKPDPDVKMEGDGLSPSGGGGYMDDEFYEDTGELTLPGADNKDVWITRIPKWLYEAVSKADDLEEGNDDDQITLGDFVFFPDPNRAGGVDKTRSPRIFFNEKWAAKTHLPRAFELQNAAVTPAASDLLANTYVFTEKDLPGYKPQGFGQGRMGGMGNSSNFGNKDNNGRIVKRSKYKKAIPKQTALLGSATREYAAIPLNTPEFHHFTAVRNRQAVQGSNTTTNIVDHFNDHTAAIRLQNNFKSFVRPTTAPKNQLNKAARIPKNELIDILHNCFDQYAYWPMKHLKAKTRQPEAYLKEVLQDIAELIKSGFYSSSWKRMGFYQRAEAANQIDGMPPDTGDDDEEEEFVDVP
ncbi:hypothetical protein P154DRAFT_523272 [Amniculicola lignicola CBS 123094]|uniref:Transcription initiation factor IIF subunit beta n=1 Tax=Amniculicola lignicola CBS 123094 TaxID=1392246 RepID=A0A6A5WC70_9PLEO|nr:hypothetical protein P154DRAFT_523272 [Amniculicola lignicola CBS 123094]